MAEEAKVQEKPPVTVQDVSELCAQYMALGGKLLRHDGGYPE